MKEENYVARFRPHCTDHCKKLWDGTPIIRKDNPCNNHELNHWEDCWECYLESK